MHQGAWNHRQSNVVKSRRYFACGGSGGRSSGSEEGSVREVAVACVSAMSSSLLYLPPSMEIRPQERIGTRNSLSKQGRCTCLESNLDVANRQHHVDAMGRTQEGTATRKASRLSDIPTHTVKQTHLHTHTQR
jgi:hypothetical protein